MLLVVAFIFSVITSLEVSPVSTLNNDENLTFSDLVQRLDTLQQMNDRKVSELAGRVDKMERIYKKNSQNMSIIDKEMMDMRSENKYLKERLTSLESKHRYTQEEQSLSTRSVVRNKRAGSGAVAFHATMTRTMTGPSTNDIIVFNNVVTNIGSVQFSTTTGVYTSSHPGGHVFTWSVMVNGQHWVVTELVRNGAAIGSLDTGDDLYAVSGSGTVAVELASGDQIWVRVSSHASGADIIPVATTFTGFMV